MIQWYTMQWYIRIVIKIAHSIIANDAGQCRTDNDIGDSGIKSEIFSFLLLLSLLTIISRVKYYESQQATKAEQMEKSSKVSNIQPNGSGTVMTREQYDM